MSKSSPSPLLFSCLSLFCLISLLLSLSLSLSFIPFSSSSPSPSPSPSPSLLPPTPSHVSPSIVKKFTPQLDPTTGYWSPSDSTIDWCEDNYAHSHYIAELYNCLSSLAMTLFGMILFYRGYLNHLELRYLLFHVAFSIVGLGSAYFHGTLTVVGQMADELPMVYSSAVWHYILGKTEDKREGTRFFQQNDVEKQYTERREGDGEGKGGIFSFPIFRKCDSIGFLFFFYCLFVTILHSLKTYVIVFQINFMMLVLIGIIRVRILQKRNGYDQYDIVPKMFYQYVFLFALAVFFWFLDCEMCEIFHSIGFNPQFHAWWHLLCAIDVHIGIVGSELQRGIAVAKMEWESARKQYVISSQYHSNHKQNGNDNGSVHPTDGILSDPENEVYSTSSQILISSPSLSPSSPPSTIFDYKEFVTLEYVFGIPYVRYVKSNFSYKNK